MGIGLKHAHMEDQRVGKTREGDTPVGENKLDKYEMHRYVEGMPRGTSEKEA